MGTTINLYYTYRSAASSKWELTPNRLLIIDNITDYLATKTKLAITNFQYIKNELEIGINVDLAQSYAQPKTATSFKYVSIQNEDELIHYYFVKKAIWRSKTCVRFELVMDVLNTFEEGRDYIFKDNTRIIREHKDRFHIAHDTITFSFGGWLGGGGELYPNDSVFLATLQNPTPIFEGKLQEIDTEEYTLTIKFNAIDIASLVAWINATQQYTAVVVAKDSNNYFVPTQLAISSQSRDFYRDIDNVSENINPILYHSNRYLIENSKSLLRQNWYLLYRNQENPTESLMNPVDCYLIPENATNVDSGTITSAKITAASLVYGKYYYARIYEENLIGQVLIRQKITLPDGTEIDGSETTRYHYGTYIEITRNRAETLNLIIYNYYQDLQIIGTYLDLDYIQLDNLPFKYVRQDSRRTSGFYLNSMWNNESEWTNTTNPAQIYSIKQLDRTDAKNIKLIKLPYCPYNFTISSGKIAVSGDDKWNYSSFTQANNIDFYALKMADLNVKLTSNISHSVSPLDELKVQFPSTASIDDLRTRYFNQEPESKLLHSDFYRPTYVYDSFSFYFQMEKLNIGYYEYNPSEINSTAIQFDMTSTINSKFMFTFTNYVSNLAEQNYYNVMPVARNNEEVLYNVPYINYIRTGFNYDVKAKNVATASNVIGMGLSVGSIAASLLAPSVPLKVAGVVASLVSVAMSVKNTVVSAINNENSIKQKILSTQNQASSVAGSDDVDLMSIYADNRLSYIKYTPTPLMTSILKDLFFFAGYNSGRLGLPNHNTRVNFDYLECEASIEKIASIPDECLTELINCFKAGITYLHKTTRTANKWDFEQKYENWEKWLFVA